MYSANEDSIGCMVWTPNTNNIYSFEIDVSATNVHNIVTTYTTLIADITLDLEYIGPKLLQQQCGKPFWWVLSPAPEESVLAIGIERLRSYGNNTSMQY